MYTARSSTLKTALILLAAIGIGALLANPAGLIGRIRYWMPFGDKVAALDYLVATEAMGAESELTRAIESDDPALQLCGARHLAAFGHRRGLETIVRLCDEDKARPSEPRIVLRSLLIYPESIEHYDSIAEWYAEKGSAIRFEPTARWKGNAPN